MSVSAVSNNNSLSQTGSQGSAGQAEKLFKQLASSLKSGNLSGAQQAYSSLQKLMQGGQSGSQTASAQNSSFQNDFAALGQALNSGNLSQAQGDFSKIQSDLQSASSSSSAQSAHRGHHHHHSSGASSGAASQTTTSASQTTSGSTVSIYA